MLISVKMFFMVVQRHPKNYYINTYFQMNENFLKFRLLVISIRASARAKLTYFSQIKSIVMLVVCIFIVDCRV